MARDTACVGQIPYAATNQGRIYVGPAVFNTQTTATTARDILGLGLRASLYLSASSFKQTTQELIEDEFSHNNPGVVAYYATIMATFPTAISDL
ncbi:hypothetical protein HAV15_010792 [Penicillium sp. str. |nr:hypothetical protein HAV15_010792 [Penicillium sp. str. \